MRRMRTVAVALLLLALAGCNGPADPGTTSTSALSTSHADVAFDGEAALGFVRLLALREDGAPRFRIPGTEGQQEGAAALWDALAVPGWTRSWHNFTGEEYLALDRSAVAGYGKGTLPCSWTEERVRGLPFANLLAVRRVPGNPGAPLVLLAAHWDSQAHSDFDPDPARRCQPDPGANDGASGVGVLLQLMRELEGAKLPFAVGILLLDGEDGFFDAYPLAGSLHFAQRSGIAAGTFILLDMVGDAGARYIRESASVRSNPRLVDLLWRHGHAQGGREAFTQQQAQIIDDHVAFIHAGVPSVDIIDAGRPGFPPQWNTTQDTVDKLSPDMLALVGRTLEATLQDPAFEPDPA